MNDASKNDALRNALISMMTDGFNRSLRALEDAGAIDRTELNREYSGMGSRYYDIVTQQFEITADYGIDSIARLFDEGV